MPWTIHERPKLRVRAVTNPQLNINKVALFINRAACESIGIDENNDRWLLLLYDLKNPNKLGLWFWKDKRNNYSENLYKVTFMKATRTAKIGAISFIQQHKLYEKAKKVGRTTFPLIPDKTKESDCMPFFAVIKAEESSEKLKDSDSIRE